MKRTFSREDIVEAAFQVVRKQGRKKLSARTIAKELNASTMPIYSAISSMKELEEEVSQKFTELLLQYCLTPWTGNFLVDMSFGYVRFAKDEKELFRLMFLDDEPSKFTDYNRLRPFVFQTLTARLKEEPNFKHLDEQQIHHITQNLEIIIHGLACLINYGRLLDDSDEYIQQYLEEVSAFFVQRVGDTPGLVKKDGVKMSTNVANTWSPPTPLIETLRTWVRPLNSYGEIPQEFRAAFPKYKGPFPYTLFIPEDKYMLFLHRSKKILTIVDGQIVLLEVGRNKIEKFSSPISEVLYLERGKILLYSWFTIQTLSGAISLKFNTVSEGLFNPVFDKIRQGVGVLQADEAALGEEYPESAKFDYLRTVDFKYMNYGRKSIRPGDTVVGIVYQPECCVQEYTLFNKTFFRRYATSHLSILTEQELILIKQPKQIKTEKEALYGGIFTYIPRHRVQAISFTANPEQNQRTMEITLPDNLHLSSEFSFDNKELRIFEQKCRDIGNR
jgi:AcrR family transcriptional regulator